jgi:hypothetical protein
MVDYDADFHIELFLLISQLSKRLYYRMLLNISQNPLLIFSHPKTYPCGDDPPSE